MLHTRNLNQNLKASCYHPVINIKIWLFIKMLGIFPYPDLTKPKIQVSWDFWLNILVIMSWKHQVNFILSQNGNTNNKCYFFSFFIIYSNSWPISDLVSFVSYDAFLLTMCVESDYFKLLSTSCQLRPAWSFSSDRSYQQGVSACRSSAHRRFFVCLFFCFHTIPYKDCVKILHDQWFWNT